MFRRAVHGSDVRRFLTILVLSCAILFCRQGHAALGGSIAKINYEPAAERYLLPITPPRDQGDSGLCWVYAALSMLETNYLYRHPGSHIELSRGAVQLDSIADRFERLIRGEPRNLDNGGLAVEALALIRRNGLVAQRDFHDVVDSDPIFPAIERDLARYRAPVDKLNALGQELEARLGAKPRTTHLDRESLSPSELAEAVLGDWTWTEFDLARNGVEGWGPSHDPDARPDTRVMYVRLDTLIGLIHQSLAEGRAVVWGSTDHALLIYGADYDKDGKPISYWIKDSLPPYAYRADAETIHRKLNDVTVTLQ
jgi:hypothetical protein